VSCVGVVLAAGGSTRFGGDKLLFRYRGKPLVWWAAETLRRGGLEVYLVAARREVVQASTPAVVMAVEDAIRRLKPGVRIDKTPITPEDVWRILR
jgi:CTP:molybdopterin cytidylyltransferase MocA